MKKTIELKVFKGKEIDFDANGKVKNPSQKLTLTYGDLQYPKNLSNIKNLGFCKIEVVALYDEKEKSVDADGNPYLTKQMIDEALSIINGKEEVVLTDEQKQIAELKARLDAMTNSLDNQSEAKTETSQELKDARAEYERVAGKKGSPKWTLEEVLAKTQELINKN